MTTAAKHNTTAKDFGLNNINNIFKNLMLFTMFVHYLKSYCNMVVSYHLRDCEV